MKHPRGAWSILKRALEGTQLFSKTEVSKSSGPHFWGFDAHIFPPTSIFRHLQLMEAEGPWHWEIESLTRSGLNTTLASPFKFWGVFLPYLSLIKVDLVKWLNFCQSLQTWIALNLYETVCKRMLSTSHLGMLPWSQLCLFTVAWSCPYRSHCSVHGSFSKDRNFQFLKAKKTSIKANKNMWIIITYMWNLYVWSYALYYRNILLFNNIYMFINLISHFFAEYLLVVTNCTRLFDGAD